MLACDSLPLMATIINIPDDYQSIQAGIDISSNGDTVLVEPGTYNENIVFNGHNIVVGSLFLTTEDTAYISSTIIEGGAGYSVISFTEGEIQSAVLTGFTIRGTPYNNDGGIYCESSSPTISRNRIIYNKSFTHGGGIYCDNADPVITGNIISENIAGFNTGMGNGGGIYCGNNSNPVIESNMISNNTAFAGGGISCTNYSSPLIIDNIINENIAELGGGVHCYSNSEPEIRGNEINGNTADWWGGGIYSNADANPLITNDIICNNQGGEKGGGIFCYANDSLFICNTTVYCNFADTGGGIYSRGTNQRIINSIIRNNSAVGNPQLDVGTDFIFFCYVQNGYAGEGNIDVDPLFRNPENDDFHLMATYCGDPYDSPCIDAGHPVVLDSLLDCDWGLGTTRSDMGAFSGGDSSITVIDDTDQLMPDDIYLFQNYPNPFNGSTTITFSIDKPGFVTIKIYDLLGRELETPAEDNYRAAVHSLIWHTRSLPSGIYFARLAVSQKTNSIRMLLLK